MKIFDKFAASSEIKYETKDGQYRIDTLDREDTKTSP